MGHSEGREGERCLTVLAIQGCTLAGGGHESGGVRWTPALGVDGEKVCYPQASSLQHTTCVSYYWCCWGLFLHLQVAVGSFRRVSLSQSTP